MKNQHSSQKTKLLDDQITNFCAVEVDGNLFFTVAQGRNSRQLWKTDGTTKGTVFVRYV